MRCPRRLTLPFGYTISFRYLSGAEMKALDAQDDDGFWEVSSRTIYIRRRLPAKRLRYIIGHELDHAINDYRLYCVNEGIAKG